MPHAFQKGFFYKCPSELLDRAFLEPVQEV